MITAVEFLTQVQEQGSAQFAATRLAGDHAVVTRTVRRQRMVRATTGSVAAVGVAGVLAVAAAHVVHPNAGITPGSSSPPATTSTAVNVNGTVKVSGGMRIEGVAGELAALFGVSRAEAYDAIVDWLPAEAEGDPEGWVAVGDYHWNGRETLTDAAAMLANSEYKVLDSTGQPKERWRDIVILASIVEQEAPSNPDKALVAQVLQNRLDAGMPLQVSSPFEYAQSDFPDLIGRARPTLDDYDTVSNVGLPAGAIGASTRISVAAAADPPNGDYYFYLLNDLNRADFFTTYADFEAAIAERSN